MNHPVFKRISLLNVDLSHLLFHHPHSTISSSYTLQDSDLKHYCYPENRKASILHSKCVAGSSLNAKPADTKSATLNAALTA